MACAAQRQQDEWFCPRCNWRWDVNEEPPGECPEVFKAGVASMLQLMDREFAPPRPPALRLIR